MRSDIEIAQACPMQHIRDIAREAGIAEEYLEQYGNYKALSGPGLRPEGRGCRRRLCPGGAYGGHQPPLHRGLPRHWRSQ